MSIVRRGLLRANRSDPVAPTDLSVLRANDRIRDRKTTPPALACALTLKFFLEGAPPRTL